MHYPYISLIVLSHCSSFLLVYRIGFPTVVTDVTKTAAYSMLVKLHDLAEPQQLREMGAELLDALQAEAFPWRSAAPVSRSHPLRRFGSSSVRGSDDHEGGGGDHEGGGGGHEGGGRSDHGDAAERGDGDAAEEAGGPSWVVAGRIRCGVGSEKASSSSSAAAAAAALLVSVDI